MLDWRTSSISRISLWQDGGADPRPLQGELAEQEAMVEASGGGEMVVQEQGEGGGREDAEMGEPCWVVKRPATVMEQEMVVAKSRGRQAGDEPWPVSPVSNDQLEEEGSLVGSDDFFEATSSPTSSEHSLPVSGEAEGSGSAVLQVSLRDGCD